MGRIVKFLLIILLYQTINCEPLYPKYIGGLLDQTTITSMAYSSTLDQLIIAGKSSSTDIVIHSQTTILLNYQHSDPSILNWAKELHFPDRTSVELSNIQVTTSQLYILTNYPFAIITVELTDAAIQSIIALDTASSIGAINMEVIYFGVFNSLIFVGMHSSSGQDYLARLNYPLGVYQYINLLHGQTNLMTKRVKLNNQQTTFMHVGIIEETVTDPITLISTTTQYQIVSRIEYYSNIQPTEVFSIVNEIQNPPGIQSMDYKTIGSDEYMAFCTLIDQGTYTIPNMIVWVQGSTCTDTIACRKKVQLQNTMLMGCGDTIITESQAVYQFAYKVNGNIVGIALYSITPTITANAISSITVKSLILENYNSQLSGSYLQNSGQLLRGSTNQEFLMFINQIGGKFYSKVTHISINTTHSITNNCIATPWTIATPALNAYDTIPGKLNFVKSKALQALSQNLAAPRMDVYDMLRTQLNKNGCGNNALVKIQKQSPLIETVQTYILNLDPVIKSYPFKPDLTSCTVAGNCDLLIYELSNAPEFIVLNRANDSFSVNWALSSQTTIDTVYNGQIFSFSIIVNDIYGNNPLETIVKLLIIIKTSENSLCFSLSNVLSPIIVQDAVYYVGEFKKIIRYDFPPPSQTNSAYASCDSLLIYNATQVLNTGVEQVLPDFITFSSSQRRLTVYIASNSPDAPSLHGKVFKIKLYAVIPNSKNNVTSTFKLYLASPSVDECYRYKLIAPQINDMFIQQYNYYYYSYYGFSSIGSTPVNYKPFYIDNEYCDSLFTIRQKLFDADNPDQIVSPCLSYSIDNSGVFFITPINCISNKVYRLRLQGYVYDNIKQMNVFSAIVDFTLTVMWSYPCANSYQPQNVESSLQTRSFKTLYYDMSSGIALTYQIPQFINLNGICSNMPQKPTMVVDWYYSIYDYNEVLSYDNDAQILTIFTSSDSDQGEYYLQLKQFDINGKFQAAYEITVEVYNSKMCQIDAKTKQQPEKAYYQITRPATTITFISFSIIPQSSPCKYNLFTYEFLLNTTLTQPGPLPSFFIKPSYQALELRLYSKNIMDTGDYNLILRGQLFPDFYSEYALPLQVEEFFLQNTAPPQFVKPLPGKLRVYLDYEYSFQLPAIRDIDENEFQLVFVYANKETFEDGSGILQGLPKFVKYDTQKRMISIQPYRLEDAGSYIMGFVITDIHKYPKQSIAYIEIDVIDLFSMKEQEVAVVNTQRQHLQARLIKITNDGLVTIGFNESNAFNQSFINSPEQFNLKAFSLFVQKSGTYEREELNEFHIIKVQESRLLMQVQYKYPEMISLSQEKDQLVLGFNKGQNIINASAVKLPIPIVMNTRIVSYADIPIQMLKKSSTTIRIEQAMAYVQGTVTSTVVGNIAMNIIMQVLSVIVTLIIVLLILMLLTLNNLYSTSSLQMLWGMINTLQLMVIVSLLNVQHPSNVLFMLKLVAQITKFNIMPTDQIIQKYLTFDENVEPVNSHFETMDIF